jgi:hypothetical protein
VHSGKNTLAFPGEESSLRRSSFALCPREEGA